MGQINNNFELDSIVDKRDYIEISLIDIFHVIIKRKVLLGSFIVLFGIIGFAYGFFLNKPMYEYSQVVQLANEIKGSQRVELQNTDNSYIFVKELLLPQVLQKINHAIPAGKKLDIKNFNISIPELSSENDSKRGKNGLMFFKAKSSIGHEDQLATVFNSLLTGIQKNEADVIAAKKQFLSLNLSQLQEKVAKSKNMRESLSTQLVESKKNIAYVADQMIADKLNAYKWTGKDKKLKPIDSPMNFLVQQSYRQLLSSAYANNMEALNKFQKVIFDTINYQGNIDRMTYELNTIQSSKFITEIFKSQKPINTSNITVVLLSVFIGLLLGLLIVFAREFFNK